jgi:hypothetical protein
VIFDKSQMHSRKTKINVGIYEEGKKIQTASATFLGPTI